MRRALPLAVLLALATPAAASAPTQAAVSSTLRPVTLEGLAQDLDADTAARRGYAVRELRRRARVARSAVERRPTSESGIEGRVDLADMRVQVAPALVRAMREHPQLISGGSAFLASLRDPRWLDALIALRSTTEKPSRKRKLDRVIDILSEAR